jgi:NitT/TauT family transport system ATP-binding protein
MNIILGFIPLLDSASLVVATERGFAAQEGIELTLVRETSWANIRDRLIIGHFDAAHLLGPMAVASTLGIGHVRVPLIAPFALGRGGNAITASLRLWEQMERAGAVPGGHPRVQGAALERVVAPPTALICIGPLWALSLPIFPLRTCRPIAFSTGPFSTPAI